MNLEQLRKQAKELVRAARAGDPAALDRLGGREPILANAQLVVAREHGRPSWTALLVAARAPRRGVGFSLFTEGTRRAVVLAQDEARSLGHTWIGSEHLLLGLLREGAAPVRGLELERARHAVVDAVGRSEEAVAGQIPFTAEARDALERANWLGGAWVDARHLLLGVLSVRTGTAACVLRDCGVDTDAVVGALGLADRLDPADYRPDANAAPERLSGEAASVDPGFDRPARVVVTPHSTARATVEQLTAGRFGPARFVKEREVHGRRLLAVAFDLPGGLLEPDRGRELVQLHAVVRRDDAWHPEGMCDVAAPVEHVAPHVAFGIGWSRSGCCCVGRVYRGDAQVTALRLLFPDGPTVEADAENDIALFFVPNPDEVMRPYPTPTIELLDGDRVIATQPPPSPLAEPPGR